MRKSGMHESVAERVGPCPNCRSDRLTPVTDRRASATASLRYIEGRSVGAGARAKTEWCPAILDRTV